MSGKLNEKLSEKKAWTDISTHSSIFLRLKSTDPKPRELAWHEFRARYGRVIAGFARSFNVPAQDVDDILQDVMLGFFSASSSFEYDRGRGRFRGYLKTATVHAIQRSLEKQKPATVSHKTLDLTPAAIDDRWETQWKSSLLARAVEQMRLKYKSSRTFDIYQMYVLQEQPVEAVAAKFGVSADTVYQAKTRVGKAVYEVIARLEAMEA